MTKLVKNIGGFMLAGLGSVAAVVVVLLFVNRSVWLGDRIYPWLVGLFVISLSVLLPLAIMALIRNAEPSEPILHAYDAYNAASDSCSDAFQEVEAHICRANNRYEILRPDLRNWDESKKYAQADFDGYTAAELTAHTAAMETFTSAFDSLVLAFAAIRPTTDLYMPAAVLYESHCHIYRSAVDAYSQAVHCAMIDALELNIRAAKEKFDASVMESPNPAVAHDASARADALAVAGRELEEKVTAVESRAKAFLTTANAAEGELLLKEAVLKGRPRRRTISDTGTS